MASVILPLVTGYLLGSIPFGLILTRFAGLGDLRSIGSGNIGATNVLRTGRKGLAAGTLLLDALKGAAAVALAHLVWDDPSSSLVAGFGAFFGHCFPVWLGFRGGKGVATYVGVLSAVSWVVALVFAVIWLGTAMVSRYSSLSALLAMAATPLVLWFVGNGPAAVTFAVMSAIAWAKHHQNISRLLDGTESRIGSKG